MAISERGPRARPLVLWAHGAAPLRASELFRAAGFEVKEHYPIDLLTDPSELALAAAIVLEENNRKPNRVGSDLRAVADTALMHDVTVIVLKDNDPHGLLQAAIDGLNLPTAGYGALNRPRLHDAERPDEQSAPNIHVFSAKNSWDRILREFLECGSGPPVNRGLIINTAAGPLGLETRTLFQRAFYGCTQIDVRVISGKEAGWSGAQVFEVHAESATGYGGLTHTPYFAKIGPRTEVYQEYRNYLEQVEPYIPFHLGPHLVYTRCSLGAKHGIIVGDWIAESEPLLSCAQAGRADAAIACLFNRTLRWHRALATSHPTLLASMLRPIEPTFAKRAAIASKLKASKHSLKFLNRKFLSSKLGYAAMGPIHGDMHAGNIMVRGGDAIVFDFGSTKIGPLLRDPAALEASLLVSSLRQAEDTSEWLTSIAPLYTRESFVRPVAYSRPSDKWSWFHSSVRQIRHHARQMELQPFQYMVFLAEALNRKASKDEEIGEPEATTRAAAFAFGLHLASVDTRPRSLW